MCRDLQYVITCDDCVTVFKQIILCVIELHVVKGQLRGAHCSGYRQQSVHYFGQFLNLVGIEVEFLQGLLTAKDLLRNSL